MSTITAPLRELTKSNVLFEWNEAHDIAFNKLKAVIASEPVLAYYDKTKQCVIQTDASKDGLGCCLLQNGHPIAFSSRALTKTEQQYAQIEKELLAVVFATEKFNQFVYGQRTKVHSDHKPLVAIMKKDINKVSVRLQRMLLKLLKYDIELEYLPGKEMYIADALSRNYCNDPVEDDKEMSYIVHCLSKKVSITEKRKKEFQDSIKKDPTLSKVLEYKSNNNWPKNCKGELKHFCNIKDNIFVSDDLLFKDDKLIIPQNQRKLVLEQIHTGHFGLEKNLSKARKNVYWKGMQLDIEDYISKSHQCQKYRKSNCKEPLQPRRIPERPWELIATDIFYHKFKDYLVIVDAYSNWIEVAQLQTKAIDEVIQVLKKIFATFGLPEEIVSDNNPFNSYKFKMFCDKYGIKHSPSSPMYPKSNGRAEKAVAIAKDIIRKSSSDDEISFGLMEYKNSSLKDMKHTPAELMLSRQLRTNLPCSTGQLKPKNINHANVKIDLKRKQEKQKLKYDQQAKPLPNLLVGENVMLQKNKIWVPAKVLKKLENNSFLVKDENNREFRRNRVFLNKTRILYNIIKSHDLLIDNFDLKSDAIRIVEQANEVIEDTIDNADSSDSENLNDSFASTESQLDGFPYEDEILQNSYDDSSTERQIEDTDEGEELYTTRSGRTIKKPNYFNEFIE